MNPIIKKKVSQFIQVHSNPTIADLIDADWPHLEMIKSLAEKLTGNEVVASVNEVAGEAQLCSHNGQALLNIQRTAPKTVTTAGDIEHPLRALLLSIRVLEVESFEWVHLPPELREHEINQATARSGVSIEEFRRTSAIWAS